MCRLHQGGRAGRADRTAADNGVDLIFAPPVEEMYPSGPVSTTVSVADLSSRWEGASRPTHFAGVATVVTKLFNIVGPCRAYFGEKDYQQLAVIRRMVADLSIPVEVIGCPIVREPDGLAMSSRNVYLSPDDREAAVVLRRALDAGEQLILSGETDPGKVAATMTEVVDAEPRAKLDYVAVVDPGVGGPRRALAVEAGGRWLLGPDNGLLAVAARRTGGARVWQVDWPDRGVSASFHGRDVFAPLAARLAGGNTPPGREVPLDSMVGANWPEDLDRIVYIDRFGNAMTGLRAAALEASAAFEVDGRTLTRVESFFQVPVGAAFWYENANGLAEIAVNQGRADRVLGLSVGTTSRVDMSPSLTNRVRMSLVFDEMMKSPMSAPIRRAIHPDRTLPKLPVGTQNVGEPASDRDAVT